MSCRYDVNRLSFLVRMVAMMSVDPCVMMMNRHGKRSDESKVVLSHDMVFFRISCCNSPQRIESHSIDSTT